MRLSLYCPSTLDYPSSRAYMANSMRYMSDSLYIVLGFEGEDSFGPAISDKAGLVQTSPALPLTMRRPLPWPNGGEGGGGEVWRLAAGRSGGVLLRRAFPLLAGLRIVYRSARPIL